MNDPALYFVQLTPPGRGAIATLRVEGPGAVETVQAQFHPNSGRPLTAYPPHRLVVGRFGDQRGEEIVVRRSRDGGVELHCHGGYATVAMIEEALVAAGCRRLPWRDWTTLHSGDPSRAAALVALADARTERAAAILLDQYHGALAGALAEIQRCIDRRDVAAARRQIDVLLGRANLGRRLVRPWSVVLTGRVNVGKSSLMNALAGYGRSIVHHVPGTTRDAVTAETVIDGWPVELCDTAGLRGQSDAIEWAGIQRAHQHLAQADLAILVFDRSAPWSAEDQALADRWPTALLVHNKCDLPAAPGERPEGLLTSILDGDGIENLLRTIASRLVPDAPPSAAAVPFTAEQIDSLRRLASQLEKPGV